MGALFQLNINQPKNLKKSQSRHQNRTMVQGQKPKIVQRAPAGIHSTGGTPFSSKKRIKYVSRGEIQFSASKKEDLYKSRKEKKKLENIEDYFHGDSRPKSRISSSSREFNHLVAFSQKNDNSYSHLYEKKKIYDSIMLGKVLSGVGAFHPSNSP